MRVAIGSSAGLPDEAARTISPFGTEGDRGDHPFPLSPLSVWDALAMLEREKPGWVLDELATTGRENLDHVHAGQYDAKQDAHALKEVKLLVELGLDSTKEVVDLGAGTGKFALVAVAVSREVIAVDVSEVMLDQIRAKVAHHKVSTSR